MLISRSMAVSYTHLDVYKRQALDDVDAAALAQPDSSLDYQKESQKLTNLTHAIDVPDSAVFIFAGGQLRWLQDSHSSVSKEALADYLTALPRVCLLYTSRCV